MRNIIMSLFMASLMVTVSCDEVVIPEYPIHIKGNTITVVLAPKDRCSVYVGAWGGWVDVRRYYDEHTEIEFSEDVDDNIKHINITRLPEVNHTDTSIKNKTIKRR